VKIQVQRPRIEAGAVTVRIIGTLQAETKHTDFSQIHRCYDRGLADSKTGDETPGINSSETTVVAHKNGYSNDPE
jgi:hypothetical protein